MNIIIANSNSTYTKFEKELSAFFNVRYISEKEELKPELLAAFDPEYIFFPHWSFYIPQGIYSKYKCIVFHMTDLPYGRGGSPLQNLILRGHTQTRLSAIEVVKEIDAGRIYLKKDLSLQGSARQIFHRCEDLMLEMIKYICESKPIPQDQIGEVTTFKRRKPEQSNILDIESVEKVYDYIRMLDADGYPNAFLETEHLRLEFTEATFSNNEIKAHVRITKK